MNNLHEAPMLNMLRSRYELDKIYTNTGNILISLNPYKHVAGLYENPLRYFRLLNEDDDESPNMVAEGCAPHAYVIANSALRILASASEDSGATSKRLSLNAVTQVAMNQSIVVSGESGAGKTEASKHVMNFLIVASDFMCGQGAMGNRNLLEVGEKIKKVLVESNVILEAFGNAKTVQNDNSSRFGKYIRLQYTTDNQLTSAYTETFLLEKSRLVAVGKDERNYHIFYQLIRGLHATDPSSARRWPLHNIDDFTMLTEGGCTVVGSEEADVDNFKDLVNAFKVLGCRNEEVQAIWEVLAAILHLGEVSVSPNAENADNAPCSLSGRLMSLDEVSRLLGVVAYELETSITTHQMQAGRRGSVHIKVAYMSQMEVLTRPDLIYMVGSQRH
jgi:myosin-5